MSSDCESTPTTLRGTSEVPVLARLKSKKSNLENELNNVNNAIKELEANPEVYKVLEALNKVRY